MRSPVLKLVLSMLFAASGIAPLQAAQLTDPDCTALLDWSSAVDDTQRWQPYAEQPGIWLPEAMHGEAFNALFGKPVTQWHRADLEQAYRVWNGCIDDARKARDQAAIRELGGARRYLARNVRDLVRYQERRDDLQDERQRRPEASQSQVDARQTQARQAAMELRNRHVDELLDAPADLDTLIALAAIAGLDVEDDARMQQLEQSFGYKRGTQANSAAYSLIRELRIRGPSDFTETGQPRLRDRLEQIKPRVLEALREQLAQSTGPAHRQPAPQQPHREVTQQLKSVLDEDEWQAFAAAVQADRTAAMDNLVARTKERIERVDIDEPGSLAAIDNIVREAAMQGLQASQREALVTHARDRQRTIADRTLTQLIERKLPRFPATWAGLQALDRLHRQHATGAVRRASPEAAQRYWSALSERLTEVGREALPEFLEQLDALPATGAGLDSAKENVSRAQQWRLLQADVRNDFLAAAQQRRDEIAEAVGKQRERELARLDEERQRALAAGGDPRLVGYRWIDANETMQLDFRDEDTVFVSALGMRFAGSYEVSRDDVVVKGPNGQLVYTLKDGAMIGNGVTLHRRGG